jgi:hypothetical protein
VKVELSICTASALLAKRQSKPCRYEAKQQEPNSKKQTTPKL